MHLPARLQGQRLHRAGVLRTRALPQRLRMQELGRRLRVRVNGYFRRRKHPADAVQFQRNLLEKKADSHGIVRANVQNKVLGNRFLRDVFNQLLRRVHHEQLRHRRVEHVRKRGDAQVQKGEFPRAMAHDLLEDSGQRAEGRFQGAR